jgi:hypothetical protein
VNKKSFSQALWSLFVCFPWLFFLILHQNWLNIVGYKMSDLEYILNQAKKSHFVGWEAKELKKCLDMILNLSRQDLLSLYRSKWIDDGKSIKETVFNILFTDRLGKREERIRGLETSELIEEFKNKHSGNVSLIRCEMQERYKVGRDRDVIARAFHNSIKSDQIWIVKQEKQGNK